MELAERQSDLLTALNYTKEDLLVGCPVVKDFHVRKKHVLFKNVFKVNKLSNFVSYQSCCTRKILYVKKNSKLILSLTLSMLVLKRDFLSLSLIGA